VLLAGPGAVQAEPAELAAAVVLLAEPDRGELASWPSRIEASRARSWPKPGRDARARRAWSAGCPGAVLLAEPGAVLAEPAAAVVLLAELRAASRAWQPELPAAVVLLAGPIEASWSGRASGPGAVLLAALSAASWRRAGRGAPGRAGRAGGRRGAPGRAGGRRGAPGRAGRGPGRAERGELASWPSRIEASWPGIRAALGLGELAAVLLAGPGAVLAEPAEPGAAAVVLLAELSEASRAWQPEP